MVGVLRGGPRARSGVGLPQRQWRMEAATRGMGTPRTQRATWSQPASPGLLLGGAGLGAGLQRARGSPGQPSGLKGNKPLFV